MGWLRGFEPPTLGTTSRCSNQLSYSHHISRQQRISVTETRTFSPSSLVRQALLKLDFHKERSFEFQSRLHRGN